MANNMKYPANTKTVATENAPVEAVKKEAPKKKYHSSALYAARKWQNPVVQVKPAHTGLNL